MELICPKCSKSSKNIEFVDDICVNCYVELKKSTLLDSVQIVICPITNKIRISKNLESKQKDQRYSKSKKKVKETWVCKKDVDINKIVKKQFEKLGIECRYLEEDDYVTLYFNSGDKKIEYKHPFKIKYVKKINPNESRFAGGYFEAIIQLRGEKNNIEKYREKIVKNIEKYTFISKILELKEGIDIYVGHKEKIPEILHILKLKSKRSKKLSGQRRDTKRLYRDTFLVIL